MDLLRGLLPELVMLRLALLHLEEKIAEAGEESVGLVQGEVLGPHGA